MSLELDATAAADGGTLTADGRRGAVEPGAGLRVGSLLAHFRIDARLGQGGMGEVYRATDLALDRPVAIKVLPAGVAQDTGRRERLFREARAQARLQHPNVCHIYYVGQEEGLVFFAMELVVGESLSERLARGPVPADEAVELVRQAALGLREAHRHGFTHRDVKPSNLMVDREGRIKVVDFGLVTREDPEEIGQGQGQGQGHGDAGKTGIVGTPLYMAPEQAAGGAIDVRADIYALGATLHHLVAGRPPFEGESIDELVTRHREGPRTPLAMTARRARALSAIDRLIDRMMAKRPEDRFAGYDELIDELERVSPSRTRPAGAWVRGLAALIDVIVIALAQAPAQVIADQMDRQFEANIVIAVVAPLYVAIALSRWGTTVGRWLLDLEVVTVPGLRRPSLARALVRHAIEYGPFTAAVLLGDLAERLDSGPLDAISNALAIGGLLWGFGELTRASLRTPDKRTRWDRAAGTMVRYRSHRASA